MPERAVFTFFTATIVGGTMVEEGSTLTWVEHGAGPINLTICPISTNAFLKEMANLGSRVIC